MNNEPDAVTNLSHYRIVSKIGAGGMGEVYLAQDTKLNRKVAIKFLPDSSADEQANQRLLREAQAVAVLDHPNICAVHEVGEQDGRQFIVTHPKSRLAVFCSWERESPPDKPEASLEFSHTLGT